VILFSFSFLFFAGLQCWLDWFCSASSKHQVKRVIVNVLHDSDPYNTERICTSTRGMHLFFCQKCSSGSNYTAPAYTKDIIIRRISILYLSQSEGSDAAFCQLVLPSFFHGIWSRLNYKTGEQLPSPRTKGNPDVPSAYHPKDPGQQGRPSRYLLRSCIALWLILYKDTRGSFLLPTSLSPNKGHQGSKKQPWQRGLIVKTPVRYSKQTIYLKAS
jgi:hypothetical protein